MIYRPFDSVLLLFVYNELQYSIADSPVSKHAFEWEFIVRAVLAYVYPLL